VQKQKIINSTKNMEKIVKKLKTILTMLLLSCVFIACGSDPAPEAPTPESDKKSTVDFRLDSLALQALNNSTDYTVMHMCGGNMMVADAAGLTAYMAGGGNNQGVIMGYMVSRTLSGSDLKTGNAGLKLNTAQLTGIQTMDMNGGSGMAACADSENLTFNIVDNSFNTIFYTSGVTVENAKTAAATAGQPRPIISLGVFEIASNSSGANQNANASVSVWSQDDLTAMPAYFQLTDIAAPTITIDQTAFSGLSPNPAAASLSFNVNIATGAADDQTLSGYPLSYTVEVKDSSNSNVTLGNGNQSQAITMSDDPTGSVGTASGTVIIPSGNFTSWPTAGNSNQQTYTVVVTVRQQHSQGYHDYTVSFLLTTTLQTTLY